MPTGKVVRTRAGYVQVVDAVTKQPIKGATVSISWDGDAPGSTDITDASGWVTLDPLDPSDRLVGHVYVSITAPNYASGEIDTDTGLVNTTVVVTLHKFDLSTQVLVRDAVTKAPLSGATLFVDTLRVGDATGVDGTMKVALDLGGHTVQAKLQGYAGDPFQTSVGSGTALIIELTNTVPSYTPAFIVEPRGPDDVAQTANAVLAITADNHPTDGFTIGQDGKGKSGLLYLKGSVIHVKVDHPSFKEFNGDFTIADDQPLTIELQSPDSPPISSTGVDPDPVNIVPVSQDGSGLQAITSQISVLTRPADPSEWVYPSDDFGKYFTATDARMYVGNLFIDELNSCQWILQSNRVPVYGYSSRDFDKVGQGKALVTGQLAINFVSTGYLYTVLTEFKRLASNLGTADEDLQNRMNMLYQRKNQLLTTLNGGSQSAMLGISTLPGNDGSSGIVGPTGDEMQSELDQVDKEIQDLASTLGSNSLRTAKLQLKSSAIPDSAYNATYLNIPFHIDVEYEGAGRTEKRRLETCYLGANEVIHDQSGNAIMDAYSFIARKLR